MCLTIVEKHKFNQLSGEFEQTLSPKATNSSQLNVHVHLINGAQ